MRRILGFLMLSLLLAHLAPPAYSRQRSASEADDKAYAELEQALSDLKKAAELTPKDASIYFFMLQIYMQQLGMLQRKHDRLVRAGKGRTQEARRVEAEVERIENELESMPVGNPGLWPSGPCDTPLPTLEPKRDGPGVGAAEVSHGPLGELVAHGGRRNAGPN
jgi:hypothetical protein